MNVHLLYINKLCFFPSTVVNSYKWKKLNWNSDILASPLQTGRGYHWKWSLSSCMYSFSSVQSLSCVWLFVTPWTAGRQASLSITSSRSLLNSCPSSRWYHLTISSSVVPFSLHLQSFPASGSFQMSQLFASGSQSIRVSASASVLPMNIQDWFL